MSASEAPSTSATFWTMASRSAADAATARSNALDLRGDQARVVERLLLDRAQDRLHAMRDADHDSRTDTDSLTHDEPVSRFRWRSNRTRALPAGTHEPALDSLNYANSDIRPVRIAGWVARGSTVRRQRPVTDRDRWRAVVIRRCGVAGRIRRTGPEGTGYAATFVPRCGDIGTFRHLRQKRTTTTSVYRRRRPRLYLTGAGARQRRTSESRSRPSTAAVDRRRG